MLPPRLVEGSRVKAGLFEGPMTTRMADDGTARRESVTRSHRMSLEVVPPVPVELPVGTSVSFKVRVSGTEVDLRGARVEVVASEYLVASPALAEPGDGFTETAAIAVRAPATLGTYGLVIAFPRQQIGCDVFEECELSIAFKTVPHLTSVAVWGVTSPVEAGGSLAVAVGVKSAGGCELKGGALEIVDAAGTPMGGGRLGDTPWPGTGLYWTEIGLTAPARTGTHSWRAVFPTQELRLAHDASNAAFSFAVVPPPEHRLTVNVTEAEGAAPLGGVELALGPYRAATDAMGTARLDVPSGRFCLAVSKSGFEGAPFDVEVAGDLSLQVEMKRVPQEPAIWDELL
jgi:hypothetical protein